MSSEKITVFRINKVLKSYLKAWINGSQLENFQERMVDATES